MEFFIKRHLQYDTSTTKFKKQLEQNTTDLITQPLFKASPVLFLETMDEDQPPRKVEQMEHNNISPKEHTPPETTNNDNHQNNSKL